MFGKKIAYSDKDLERVQKVYIEVTGEDGVTLAPNTKIKSTLNLDSLGLVRFIYGIEKEFGVEIPNKKINSFKKVRNILEFIATLQSE